MKLAIVGFHNLHLMQFLYKYTDILDHAGIEYDVIYWDRDMDPTIKYKKFEGTPIAFQYKMSNYQPKYLKLIGFIKCIRFAKKKIKEGQYNRLIFLTTQTILPLFQTAMKYSNRYIYDYRDITYEKLAVGKGRIQKLIMNSYMTAMSSMGFKEITGDSPKIIMAHNCSGMDFIPVKKNTSDKIRVSFWGIVRQVEFNKRICDLFGSDSRFELIYHGEGYVDALEEYCTEKGYGVIFTGRYSSQEIKAFASNTDILLNLYENDDKQTLAMTVKYYDAVRYGLPMLVTEGSYMENRVKGNNAVFLVNIERVTADEILKWYLSLECDDTITRNLYEAEIEEIKADEDRFERTLLDFVKE